MPDPSPSPAVPRLRTGPASAALLAACGLLAFLALPSSLAAAAQKPAPGPVFLGQAASAPPVLVFEPEAVVASGFAPGQEVIFHGVTRQHGGFFWRVVQTREVVVADALGEARLALPPGEVGPLSVWAVVNPVTGDLLVDKPEGSTAAEIPFPAEGLGESEAGAWRVLRTAFDRLELLYVRPGEGAWWRTAIDGGGSDHDGRQDSSLAVRLDGARPLWGAEDPPRGFRPGDVVVAVSLDTLDYFAARLVTPGASD